MIMSFCICGSQESGSEGQFLADLRTERVKVFSPMARVSFYFADGCLSLMFRRV